MHADLRISDCIHVFINGLMMIIKNIEQKSFEWLEMRKKSVTSTDSAVIMLHSPYKTPYKLWLQKLGLEDGEFDNAAMKHGREMEPYALSLFNKQYGCNCIPIVAFHEEHSFMMASIDGYDSEKKIVIEIKCPTSSKLLSDDIPGIYYSQMQHILSVTGLQLCHYVIFYDGIIHHLEVNRNDEYINELIEKEKEFYKCLQELTPPALAEKDYTLASEEWEKIDSKRRIVKQVIRELEEQEKVMKDSLISLAGQMNTVGIETKLTKVVQAGRVDYSVIPELQGVDLTPYRKEPNVFWRLT